MAKFDFKSAYRNIPVHPDDRWLLGMVWEEKLFAFPFGLRSVPMIFNAVAEALAYAEKMDHYLDDFSLVGTPKSQICQKDLDTSWKCAIGCASLWQGKKQKALQH